MRFNLLTFILSVVATVVAVAALPVTTGGPTIQTHVDGAPFNLWRRTGPQNLVAISLHSIDYSLSDVRGHNHKVYHAKTPSNDEFVAIQYALNGKANFDAMSSYGAIHSSGSIGDAFWIIRAPPPPGYAFFTKTPEYINALKDHGHDKMVFDRKIGLLISHAAAIVAHKVHVSHCWPHMAGYHLNDFMFHMKDLAAYALYFSLEDNQEQKPAVIALMRQMENRFMADWRSTQRPGDPRMSIPNII